MVEEITGIVIRATTIDDTKIAWMKFDEPAQTLPNESHYKGSLTESDAKHPMSTTSRQRIEVRK
jgi:hypothetical protein